MNQQNGQTPDKIEICRLYSGWVSPVSPGLYIVVDNSVVNFKISLGDVANFTSSSSTFEFWNYFLYNIPTALNMFELSDILFISSTCLSISFSLFSCILFFFIWCYI